MKFKQLEIFQTIGLYQLVQVDYYVGIIGKDAPSEVPKELSQFGIFINIMINLVLA